MKPNPCYERAKLDEPIFVLLGRDKHAGALVAMWAALRRIDGENPLTIADAEQTSRDMSDYCAALGKEPAGLASTAYALALLAEAIGGVVTITQQPREPLAMGNYVHAVSVRAKR